MINNIEKLAKLAHEQWSGWMKYLFSKCSMNRQGDCVIPREYWKALRRQQETSYEDLSEEEKEGDRIEARKVLDVMKQN